MALEETRDTSASGPFDLSNLARYFAERSSQAMIALEGEGAVIRYANAAFLRLVGLKTEDSLMGRRFAEAVPENDANACVALLDRVYHTGAAENLLEQEHGKIGAYWSYAVWPIFWKSDHPVGLMVQVTDSTEVATFRKQAASINEALVVSAIRQQELTEKAEVLNGLLADAVRAKDQFLAVLGHELRNPLNPVLTIASMLRQDPRLDGEAREQIEVIRRNTELASRLIDDLLDVTRLQRGKMELRCAPVDLREVIRQAVDDCAPEISQRRLHHTLDLGSAGLWINGDAGRLQQVFWNLLRNAIKFTPAGGEVGIRCTLDADGQVVAEVFDSGEGIAPELLPRLFEPFEQGGRETTRQFGGLGLGLAISKAITSLHGGHIAAYSEGKTKGTRIVVHLPLMSADAATVAASEHAARRTDAPLGKLDVPLRILLVEDHADTARAMHRLFSARGHEVAIAGSVRSALELAAKRPFNLLLSDLSLPDGSGLELMRTLRTRGLSLPGIVLSGYGQDEDKRHSIDAGFHAHLVKPVDVKELEEAIAQIPAEAMAK